MEEKKRKKVTIRQLHDMKQRKELIVALGVYDSPMAAMADRIGFEMLVIGNSGPMSLFGHRSATTIKPHELLFMTQAVSRVAKYGLIVATMPYMSYHASEKEAINNAARLVSEGGAESVQCHGNSYTAKYIGSIVNAGIPVLAHVGLQSMHKVQQSGYRVQGRTASEAKQIVGDVRALCDVGVFGFTLELVSTEVTEYLKDELPVPVLSLGSGAIADGIYLVSGDAVGYSIFHKPESAGRFVNVRPVIEDGLCMYRDQAKTKKYPGKDQTYHMDPDEYKKFRELIG